MFHVPRVDFTSTNFANVRSDEAATSTEYLVWAYTGFSDTVKAVVTATCMLGTINSFTAPASNSTWSIDFYGPSLSCSPVDAPLKSAIRDNIWTAFQMFYSRIDQVDMRDLDDGFYLSWTPGVDHLPYSFSSNLQVMTYPNITEQMLHIQSGPTYNITVHGRSLGPLLGNSPDVVLDSKPIGEISMPATLYFAVAQNGYYAGMENLTVIQCQLRNSSYNVSINFVDGVQEVDLHLSTTHNNIFAFQTLNASSGPTQLVNPTLMEGLAYQSIMDAFGSMFVGLGYTETSAYEPLKNPVMVPNSGVMSTVIGARAEELQSLRPNLMSSFLYPGWIGTSITENTHDQFSLQDGIEELFKNITLNLMTSPMLQ